MLWFLPDNKISEQFEEDVFKWLLKKIKFRRNNDEFQKQILKFVSYINK